MGFTRRRNRSLAKSAEKDFVRTVNVKRTHELIRGKSRINVIFVINHSHTATLKEHTNLHTGTKPFQCPVYQQSFSQRKGLRAHRCEEVPHSGSKKFVCPHCNRVFDTRRGLAVHTNHQHGDPTNEPILQCAQCAMTFTCEDTYEEHMLLTHD